ncbi:hypothetical protein DXG01_008132 [Tephrocybe rancida]|nr:hypothetical protein DXG01_008132 [Tephrocybe rancida]
MDRMATDFHSLTCSAPVSLLSEPRSRRDPTDTLALPYEVQELIVDHLHDDRPTLLISRLVSSRWLARSRLWLFHDVTIGPMSDAIKDAAHKRAAHAIPTLLELLRAPHSTLVPAVRTLTIFGADNIPCSCCEGLVVTGKSATYDTLSATIEAVLPLLDHAPITGVVLENLSFYFLSSTAQADIVALAPHVKQLDIRGLSYRSFEEMLAPFQRITELKIRCINIDAHANEQRSDEGPSAQPLLCALPPLSPLSSLTSFETSVGDFSSRLISPHQYILAQHITSLAFDTISSEHLANIGTFISTAGAALKHLHLCFQVSECDVFPISLSENINLETVDVSSYDVSRDLWWVEVIIPTMVSTARLELEAWVYTKAVHWVQDFAAEEIESLFSEYTDRDLGLAIHISSRGSPEVDLSSVKDEVLGALPDISRRGLVRFLEE